MKIVSVYNDEWNCFVLINAECSWMMLCAVVVSDRSTGRVGAPLTCNEVMLIDWDEGMDETDTHR